MDNLIMTSFMFSPSVLPFLLYLTNIFVAVVVALAKIKPNWNQQHATRLIAQ